MRALSTALGVFFSASVALAGCEDAGAPAVEPAPAAPAPSSTVQRADPPVPAPQDPPPVPAGPEVPSPSVEGPSEPPRPCANIEGRAPSRCRKEDDRPLRDPWAEFPELAD